MPVFRDVQTHVLVFRRDAHPHTVFDAQEHEGGDANGPCKDSKGADNLHTELLAGLASVVDVGVGSVLHVGLETEDAGCPQTPGAADAVNHSSIAGVIHAQFLEEKVAQEKEDGTDKPDDDGMPRFYQLTVRRDGNQTAKHTIESH
jgi:hypothetical protein